MWEGREHHHSETQPSTWILNDNFLTLALPNLLCLSGIFFETLNISVIWPSGRMRIFDLNDYGQVVLQGYLIKIIMAQRKYIYTR